MREIMTATVKQTNKQTKSELGNVTWRPEMGHLTPEVRAANDYVWDKLLPPFL
jgi:hypothetical protein